MSRICILGDTHFGVRGDSVEFHNYFKKFYEIVFFPYLVENEITTVIQLGDLFDRRKFINFNSLHLARKYFFDRFEELDIKLITLLGNHDIAFKNTLEVNSTELLLQGYKNIEIFNDFKTLWYNDVQLDIVPWICEENSDSISKQIKASKSQICFGHFEINGFEMDRGNVFKGGHMDKKDLLKYDMVMSGHFHHKSDDGHIYYLGTPYENTWSDYNDPRGFHIFDVNTRALEFIQNPFQIFHKISYDDKEQDSKFWNSFNFDSKKDTYVKIVVVNKTDPYLFDTVLDKLYKAGVTDVGIVEDFTEISVDDDEMDESLNQAEDTLTIMNKAIDSMQHDLDTNKLKSMLREVFVEAINKDKAE
jgi:hypothetical protein